jgi:hypothetical protein
MDDHLFFCGDMHSVLEAQRQKAKVAVEALTPAHVNAATDDEIVDNIVSRFRIEPLVIYADRAEAEHQESETDVSQHFNRAVFDRSRPCMVKANQITVRIPFTGEPDLFKVRPSSFTLNPPRGCVQKSGDHGGVVLITMTRPIDEGVDEFNRWMKSEVKSIEDYAATSRSDIERFNADLVQQVRGFVSARRTQLQKQGQLLATLAIPLRRSSTNTTPLPMPKRVLKPLPSPRNVEQEYTISGEDYEYILNVLRHQSRSFEQTPSAYRKLDEEELRDVLLSTLNTHFEGDAAGERFRRKGKTDVCVEFANRAAFVGECKVWGGPKVASDALDQLLGYLTWRDCHTALVLFNKTVKGFKDLQESMPALIAAHPRFHRNAEAGHSGEWRAVFKANGDDARLITIHLFLVDLSPDATGRSRDFAS